MEYKLRNGLCYDPVEDTQEYKKVIEKVEKEIEERMKGFSRGFGRCHIY